MELAALFQKQQKIDKENKQHDFDTSRTHLSEMKLLDLYTSLGLCANIWKEDMEQKEDALIEWYETCRNCNGQGFYTKANTQTGISKIEECFKCKELPPSQHVLDAYISCLGVLLSIGNDLSITFDNKYMKQYARFNPYSDCNVETLFVQAFRDFAQLCSAHKLSVELDYAIAFMRLLYIGQKLGFSEEVITNAFHYQKTS